MEVRGNVVVGVVVVVMQGGGVGGGWDEGTVQSLPHPKRRKTPDGGEMMPD